VSLDASTRTSRSHKALYRCGVVTGMRNRPNGMILRTHGVARLVQQSQPSRWFRQPRVDTHRTHPAEVAGLLESDSGN